MRTMLDRWPELFSQGFEHEEPLAVSGCFCNFGVLCAGVRRRTLFGIYIGALIAGNHPKRHPCTGGDSALLA